MSQDGTHGSTVHVPEAGDFTKWDRRVMAALGQTEAEWKATRLRSLTALARIQAEARQLLAAAENQCAVSS